MKRSISISKMIRALAGLWRDRRGVTGIATALSMVVLAGFAGLAIDIGHVLLVQRELQASTDAAALAGAYDINCCSSAPGTAITTAKSYSAVAGGKNAISNVTVTMASGYPLEKCLTSTGISCNGPDNANAIVVKQQATVPMFFAQILGVKPFNVSATSTGGAKGGTQQALNIMIVLDTTKSMSTSTDSGCGLGANATREQCALAGVQALLSGLNPSLDYVGLMVFPGILSASDASDDYTCGKTLPSSDIQTYSNAPVYQIVGLSGSNNFKSSSSSTTLNSSSDIVLATGGTGGGGCSSGVTAPGGEGTYYAEAINAAQAALTSFAAPHTQNVIVFLSDGGANSTKAETDVTGYISGTTLTVTACPNGCSASSTTSGEGPLAAGQSITGTGVTAGTTIVSQLSGTTGGVGTYKVSVSQTVGSKTNTQSLTAANVLTLNGESFNQNTNQCQQAIAAAQAAAKAGTWVYSIAYGSSTATGSSSTCTTDTSGPLAGLSSCTTMQDIAASPTAIPDATKFYSNGNNGVVCPGSNSIANLVTLFQNLSTNLSQPRLLPNNTT